MIWMSQLAPAGAIRSGSFQLRLSDQTRPAYGGTDMMPSGFRDSMQGLELSVLYSQLHFLLRPDRHPSPACSIPEPYDTLPTDNLLC